MDFIGLQEVMLELGYKNTEILAAKIGVRDRTVINWIDGTWAIPDWAEKFLQLLLKMQKERTYTNNCGDCFDVGKEIGYTEGYDEGYPMGYAMGKGASLDEYKRGYADGRENTMIKMCT